MHMEVFMIETTRRPGAAPVPGAAATRRTEMVGEHLVGIQVGLRAGDVLAVGRGMVCLDAALRGWHGWLHNLGFEGDDLREAHQRVLLRLYGAAQRHVGEEIRNPDAFARQAAAWELRDLARERRGAAELDLDDAHVLGEVEASGVRWREDPVRLLEDEREMEEARRTFHRFFRQYRQLASAARPSKLAGKHLTAWFVVRVQRRRADEAARTLRVSHLAGGGRQVVWQWAKRGCERVLRLAAVDPQPERARVMREAAMATSPPRRSP
jgi:hypothetical protein